MQVEVTPVNEKITEIFDFVILVKLFMLTDCTSSKREVMGGLENGMTEKRRDTVSLPYNHKLIPRAKELRKDATEQEKCLWYKYLSQYPIRFQRQKTIGRFIADFYCAKAKLAIELDGSQHFSNEGKAYDESRTAGLEEYGITVIRFSNAEVDKHFESVCEVIDKTVRALIKEI
ncbi:MAG: endonuclease domain-containing protein [Christensenellales bacterium]